MRSLSTLVVSILAVFAAQWLGAPAIGQQSSAAQKPASAQSTTAGKQPQATFRAQVDLVAVDAVVHDKSGQFIADLAKEDFEVFEDGKPQKIEGFELVNVPVDPRPLVALATETTIEPDVFTNEVRPQRVYLIVMDDLHINGNRTIAARKLARQFIERTLAPNDVAAVVSTSGSRTSAQEFTSNKRLLLDAVDKVVGRKITSPALADMDTLTAPGIYAPGATGGAKLDERQRLFNALSTLDSLAYLAQFASTIHNRRKSIVLIGEGIDYDLGANEVDIHATTEGGTPEGSAFEGSPISRRQLRDRLRDFVDVANRSNVTLYAFDPTVYTQGGDDLVDIGAQVPGFMDQYGRETVYTAKLMNDVQAAQDNLRTMASETGGFAVTGSLKAAADAVDRIRAENSHYYLLGYYASNTKRDGKFRKIEVKVKRAGVAVVARQGYAAPKNDKKDQATPIVAKEGTSPALRDALASTLPAAGLPVAVTAVPFRGSAQQASVLVMLETPPGAVQFASKEGRFEGTIEVAVVAADDTGRPRGGERLEIAMPLKAETYAVIRQVGLLFQSRINLPPGRYVLRAGARDASNDRTGSVHCDVDVPDFESLPLSMSGLLVASAAVQAANPRPDPALSKLLPISPTVRRQFPLNDELLVLAEVYDMRAATPHQVDIVTSIIAEDGREVFKYEGQHSSTEIQGARGGYGSLVKVPLKGLPAGSYVLRVEARSRLDVDRPVVRETEFRIVGRR